MVEDNLRLFDNLWKDGYFEGDPLNRVARSTYDSLPFSIGYISVIFAVYQMCIKPYINQDNNIIEIGPGRGAWTKTMLQFKEIWCLDVVSAEENKFWEYIGEENKSKVEYKKVDDFSCSCLPPDYFDFLFSYNTFCHITFEGQKLYYENLFSKLKNGANAFIMYVDFDKRNIAMRNIDNWRVRRLPGNPIKASFIEFFRYMRATLRKPQIEMWDKNDTEIRKGRHYHTDPSELHKFIESIGYKIINPDVGLSPLHTIIHIMKP